MDRFFNAPNAQFKVHSTRSIPKTSGCFFEIRVKLSACFFQNVTEAFHTEPRDDIAEQFLVVVFLMRLGEQYRPRSKARGEEQGRCIDAHIRQQLRCESAHFGYVPDQLAKIKNQMSRM